MKHLRRFQQRSIAGPHNSLTQITWVNASTGWSYPAALVTRDTARDEPNMSALTRFGIKRLVIALLRCAGEDDLAREVWRRMGR